MIEGMRVKQTEAFARRTMWAKLYGPKAPLTGTVTQTFPDARILMVKWEGDAYPKTECAWRIEPIDNSQMVMVI